MLETPEQLQYVTEENQGNSHHAILLGNDYCRIHAPTETDVMCSVILWEKLSPEDVTPTWEKVVCFLFFVVF